jgi:hypothetical protein
MNEIVEFLLDSGEDAMYISTLENQESVGTFLTETRL